MHSLGAQFVINSIERLFGRVWSFCQGELPHHLLYALAYHPVTKENKGNVISYLPCLRTCLVWYVQCIEFLGEMTSALQTGLRQRNVSKIMLTNHPELLFTYALRNLVHLDAKRMVIRVDI